MNLETIENAKDQVRAARTELRQRFFALAPIWRIVLISIVIVGIIAIASGIKYISTLGSKDRDVQKPSLTVAVEPATIRSMERTLDVTGTITAWDPLSIGAEIGGLRIDTVNVEEGDFVKKGQVLASLNSSVLQAQLSREQAVLQRSRANLSKTIQPNRQQDISALKFAVEQAKAQIAEEEAYLERAKANLENAKINARRYDDLVKQGAVSKEEAESRLTLARTNEAEVLHAQNGVAAARFAARQAMERLSQGLEGGRKEDIQMSKALVSETQANVNALEAQIAQTVIRAPSDGLITKRDAHIGDISVATKPLFFMVRDNRLEVRAQVPERDLQKLSPKQSVDITGAMPGNATIQGTVREISPLVDVDTRLGTVRIDIPFIKGMHPGMFVHGLVRLGKEDVLTVPASAVVDRHERSCVFVIENNKAISQAVSCAERFGKYVEIRDGLNPGQEIVVSGAGFLKDGDIVRIGQAEK